MSWFTQPITGMKNSLTLVHPRHTLGHAQKRLSLSDKRGRRRSKKASESHSKQQSQDQNQFSWTLNHLSLPSHHPLPSGPSSSLMPHPPAYCPRPLCLAAKPEALEDPQTERPLPARFISPPTRPSAPPAQLPGQRRPGTAQRSESQRARTPAF